MTIKATEADRQMVEPVMEIARTSDLPQWALTLLHDRAALVVAMAREDGRQQWVATTAKCPRCAEEAS